MTRGTGYVLGYRLEEQERLEAQAEQLGPESARLFDEIGPLEGQRVAELGCGPRGCIGLLSARVGRSGSVTGVDISADAVARAQAFAAGHDLGNVRVMRADAGSTGLPTAAFDLVTSRLLLVNIPAPARVVSEALRLARPGGAVAFHEVDWAALICDPPSGAWTELTGLYLKVAEKNGIDCYIGRKLPRMLGDAGVTDVRVRPSMHVHPLGDPRRMVMLKFADNFKDQILAHGLLSADDFAVLKDALAAHLRDPGTTVFLGPYIQAWGRKPVDAVPRSSRPRPGLPGLSSGA